MGSDDSASEMLDAGVKEGRLKASMAPGQDIQAGFPTMLPEWLYRVRARPRVADRVVRRGNPHGARKQIDWELTLKHWARRGHSDGALVWERAPYGLAPLIFLWDVSGSMKSYLSWYFPWLYRLSQTRPGTHVFAFGTDVADLTPYLHHDDYSVAVQAVYSHTALWSSGTTIGRALADWDHRFGRPRVGPASRLVIISDGWDVGSAELLELTLRSLTQRVREVLWINPLMVTAGFEPRTRALRVALQYVKEMASGATREDLLRLSWRFGVTV